MKTKNTFKAEVPYVPKNTLGVIGLKIPNRFPKASSAVRSCSNDKPNSGGDAFSTINDVGRALGFGPFF